MLEPNQTFLDSAKIIEQNGGGPSIVDMWRSTRAKIMELKMEVLVIIWSCKSHPLYNNSLLRARIHLIIQTN